MSAPTGTPVLHPLVALRRAASKFFLEERPVTPVVAYRMFLAGWLLFFWAPRLPHAWELYCRPVLRHVHKAVKVLEHPLPPLWLMQGALVLLLVSLVGLGLSRRPRLFHVIALGPTALLFAFDTLMPRAYGGLAFLQFTLLFIAPYDQLHDDDGPAPSSPAQSSPAQRGPAQRGPEQRGPVLKGPVTGQRMLQLQWAAVYLFAVPAKIFGGRGWLDGTVLWRTFHSDRYGDWLLSHVVELPLWLCQVGCYFTLGAELFVGLGIWFKRTRRVAMVLCVLLHLGMTLTLRVSLLFPTLMIGHLLLFITVDEWDRVLAWIERRRPSTH